MQPTLNRLNSEVVTLSRLASHRIEAAYFKSSKAFFSLLVFLVLFDQNPSAKMSLFPSDKVQ